MEHPKTCNCHFLLPFDAAGLTPARHTDKSPKSTPTLRKQNTTADTRRLNTEKDKRGNCQCFCCDKTTKAYRKLGDPGNMGSAADEVSLLSNGEATLEWTREWYVAIRIPARCVYAVVPRRVNLQPVVCRASIARITRSSPCYSNTCP